MPTNCRSVGGQTSEMTSPKLTYGHPRPEFVLGHNFELARHLTTIDASAKSTSYELTSASLVLSGRRSTLRDKLDLALRNSRNCRATLSISVRRTLRRPT